MRSICVLALLTSASSGLKREFDFHEWEESTSRSAIVATGVERGALVEVEIFEESSEDVVVLLIEHAPNKEESDVDFVAERELSCFEPASFRAKMAPGERGEFVFNGPDSLYDVRIVTKCDSMAAMLDMRVSGAVSIVNPSLKPCQHLALEHSGFVSTYACLLAGYVLLVAHTLRVFFCSNAPGKALQKAWSVAVLMKTTSVAIDLWFYKRYGRTGRDGPQGYVLASTATSVAEVFFLGAALLTALGWNSMEARAFSTNETLALTCTTVSFLVVALARALASPHLSWSESDDSLMNGALLLGEFVIKAIVMLGVLVALNFNIAALRAVLDHADRVWSVSTASRYASLKRYVSLRFWFAVYLCTPTGVLVLNVSVLSWRDAWAISTLEEACLFTIYLFSLRAMAPKHERRHDYVQREPFSILHGAAVHKQPLTAPSIEHNDGRVAGVELIELLSET